MKFGVHPGQTSGIFVLKYYVLLHLIQWFSHSLGQGSVSQEYFYYYLPKLPLGVKSLHWECKPQVISSLGKWGAVPLSVSFLLTNMNPYFLWSLSLFCGSLGYIHCLEWAVFTPKQNKFHSAFGQQYILSKNWKKQPCPPSLSHPPSFPKGVRSWHF